MIRGREFGGALVPPADERAGHDAGTGAHRLARGIRCLVVATVVANLVYFGTLLLPGNPANELVNVWLALVVLWIPVALVWLVAARTGFSRWEVILASAGMTSNAIGDTTYSLLMDESGYLPSPSLADPAYLLYYALTIAALVVLVRRQSSRVTGSVLFDSSLAALGAAAVLAVILGPVFADATSDTTFLDGTIAALYPLFDLLLLAAVVAISASPVLRMGPRWQLLVVGLLLFTGADIAYALLSGSGGYETGTPLDAVWAIGVACSALWVEGVGHTRSDAATRAARVPRIPVAALAVLAGLAVLLFATQVRVPVVALVLAAAAIALAAALVMVRHATMVRLIDGQDRVVARLTELDRAKSEMIGTVSHEMRTPLTSILGFLELVLDDADEPLPAPTKNMLVVADRNARRLHELVGNMLILTSLESGTNTRAHTPVEISRVLRRTVESLEPLARSREVIVTAEGDDSAIVEGDEIQLERAFTNLVENALKFTPAGGTVRVTAEAGVVVAGRAGVRIVVDDTGMGIPAPDVPRLFDRFFRADNAKNEVVPGTGLGLAVVRGIVESHHGDITVASVLGEGTTFSVTLPARAG
jgi:signal transduction histidine kinase